MNKKITLASVVACVAIVLAAAAAVTSCHSGKQARPYTIKNGTIVFDEPAPAEGQQDMLQFAAAPIDTVRIGFIGLGMRGSDAVKRYTHIDGVKIVALCDLEDDRVTAAAKTLAESGLPEAAHYAGEGSWQELCRRPDIDLVYVCTDWKSHAEIAVYAMRHGKHVALEVPAATSVAECWQLVDVSEQTRRHCIMLENCVYDFFEVTTLNMVQQGLFGEVMHVEGSYIHDLSAYWKAYHDNWRLSFDQSHAGDVYATHGLGPDCQVLDIHRGDRMERLVSMATKSVAGLRTASEIMGAEDFANGDQTSTLIRTAGGKTITLQHNVYTPRPYDRMYQVVGTQGYAEKYPRPGYAFDASALKKDTADGSVAFPDYEDLTAHRFVPESVRDRLLEQYKPAFVREIEDKAREVGGHGGMDFIMDWRLIWCLRNGKPLDMDVYDAAEWSCIGELSAASIENGSMPVLVPDFTRGRWQQIRSYRHAQ